MKYLLLILLTLSTAAQAELSDWYQQAIKVPSSNELPLLSNVQDGCKAMNRAELLSISEGVLVRSRIRPIPTAEYLNNGTKYPVYLSVKLKCSGDGPYSIDLDIDFWKAMPRPYLMFDWEYGATGRQDTAGLKVLVKESVEKAITDYVRFIGS